MKKILFSILLLGLVFSSACSNESLKTVKKKEEVLDTTISIGANYVQYEEESSLFEDAELVVIAKIDKDFNEREHIVTYFPSSSPQQQKEIEDYYTKTPITIKKVLKKPEGFNLDKNSTLTVIEPLSLIDDVNGKRKITTEHYREMGKGQKYVIYLKKNTYGEYSVINMNNGRFNLDVEEELKGKEIDIDIDKIEKHNNMKKEIMQKYEKEIKETKA